MSPRHTALGRFIAAKWKPVIASSAIFFVGAGLGAGYTYLHYERKEFLLRGEVFLQLRSGEIRHAAGARVYVFHGLSRATEKWLDVMSTLAKAEAEKKNIDERELVEALRKSVTIISAEGPPKDQGKLPGELEARSYIVNCDSSGRFSIRLPAGSYTVIATGRAGFNEAVWWNVISVPETRNLSLAEPVVAYLDSTLREH